MIEVAAVTSQTVAELRRAVKDCSERGLIIASKWASELLLAIPPSKRSNPSPPASPSRFSTSTPARTGSPDQSVSFPEHSPTPGPSGDIEPLPHVPPLLPHSHANLAFDSEMENRERDLIAAARIYLEAKEFMRAVHLLRLCTSAKAQFISVYCQFMASEKKALQDWHKLDNNRHQPPVPVNTSLLDLLGKVSNATDPWLLFLKGLFLSRLSRREEALESIILSIGLYPWNWSCWVLLGSCIGDADELSGLLPLLPLPNSHPLVQMFSIKIMNELNNPSEHELAMCSILLGDEYFPSSLWLMSQRACASYHNHDYGQARIQFEQVFKEDPYRIDDIDIYSNILYVTDNKLKLSSLAHEFLALDKDRPEVCCLVGNYYSMRGEREKAIKQFRRATQLDRTYLSAWTLMGHEFVEMKNSHAAIEAYRRAVDVNRKDYRAWFGLGQAYEFLNMPQYALYYYQHATALRPYDIRLWQGQGLCFEALGRPREAIECLKRALIGADPHETKIILMLAKLHHDMEEYMEAAAYHRRVVEISIADDRQVQEFSRSCLYVAQYHMTTPGGDFNFARDYLERVATSNASDVQEATEMLKKVIAMQREHITLAHRAVPPAVYLPDDSLPTP